MNLKGMKVRHITWGVGTIEDHNGEMISVRFSDAPDGERYASFSILESFEGENAFLSTLDDKAEIIEQAIEDLRCDVCKEIAVFAEVVDGKRCCSKCAEGCLKDCTICGRRYFHTMYDGSAYYNILMDEKMENICPECIKRETFVCTKCGMRTLKSELASSKYILPNRQICKFCVEECAACGALIDENHTIKAYGNCYCTDCWDTKTSKCSICYYDFIPDNPEQKKCPDCTMQERYIEHLRSTDFSSMKYKHMFYYELEYIDRCELFTQLYENNMRLYGATYLNDQDNELFHFLVMDILLYKVVIAYLPHMPEGIKHSLNVTMTEFRKNANKNNVIDRIKDWTEDSTDFVETSAGRMKIMYYPVLLRVQTDYDKIYGKEWNGPYDYNVIGNYGDTTDFYMIGILE